MRQIFSNIVHLTLNIIFGKSDLNRKAGGIEAALQTCNCANLMNGAGEPPDVFSCRYCNGVSQRLASLTMKTQRNSQVSV